ncbi:chemotaxis response regulator protein-glutamate methylesterase [Alkalihalophilus marmarensis]|uniref:Protein-glutamate methylesterase/protein-glutamine glutaminase n=1 Tax=Alkalihalophilus marmarensis DSM 21297 TaxID=1188261 RepID=U6SNI6_9BACI|nr:chemotaxis response regulator protein-glutamate methylesterase [Alkalihalophilus marmarensis]ERN53294.1 chemotaxis protein CheY [Alkalihalophilus marmarensis DSM 21297]MCM3489561.1 chemotaxis response regulator protein-glutamate methylesterase [Alkalihalophilus marmarensis]
MKERGDHMVEQINVLVVDDSAFMRKVISDMLTKDPHIHVVGTARNGKEALTKRVSLAPDVITLDVEMPVMDGISTLKQLMKHDPIPVVMISSLTKEGALQTLLAMELGAVDFVAKTSGAISLDLHVIEKEIVQKVKLASQANLMNNTSKRHIQQMPSNRPFVIKHSTSSNKKVIAIGTSTGGPKALKEVLTNLPKEIDAPIVIVQHMPSGFTQSLAQRLDTLSHIDVKEAASGDILRNGTAYIAPGGSHMEIMKTGQAYSIHLHKGDMRRGHRPSVDVLFESLAKFPDLQKIAVIMTGMGSDGKAGLEKLKETGLCFSLAESVRTSVVYGMPKAAIEAQLIDEISDLDNISDHIMRQLNHFR